MIINDPTKNNGIKASGLGNEQDTGNTDSTMTLADVQAAATAYQIQTGLLSDKVPVNQNYTATLNSYEQAVVKAIPSTPIIAGISNTTLAILAGLAAVLLIPKR